MHSATHAPVDSASAGSGPVDPGSVDSDSVGSATNDSRSSTDGQTVTTGAMTWRSAWSQGAQVLAPIVESEEAAFREVRFLIESVLQAEPTAHGLHASVGETIAGSGSANLWTQLDQNPSQAQLSLLDQLVARRLQREPLAYVLGEWSFRRLDLVVGPGVLVPRPETEMVVQSALGELWALKGTRPRGPEPELLVADLGSGSGAISLSLVDECDGIACFAVERSRRAAAVMEQNLLRHPQLASRVTLCMGSWFQALPAALEGQLDMVISNPPYVSESEWMTLDPEVAMWEPKEALVPARSDVAGPQASRGQAAVHGNASLAYSSGLEDIEAILAQAPQWLRRPGTVVMEIASDRAIECQNIALAAGADEAMVVPDLAQRPRTLVARWL